MCCPDSAPCRRCGWKAAGRSGFATWWWFTPVATRTQRKTLCWGWTSRTKTGDFSFSELALTWTVWSFFSAFFLLLTWRDFMSNSKCWSCIICVFLGTLVLLVFILTDLDYRVLFRGVAYLQQQFKKKAFYISIIMSMFSFLNLYFLCDMQQRVLHRNGAAAVERHQHSFGRRRVSSCSARHRSCRSACFQTRGW